MKIALLLMLTLIVPSATFSATETRQDFENVRRLSEDAYALAVAHLGTFKNPRINTLAARIGKDQRVVLETLKDTARMKEIPLTDIKITGPDRKMPGETFLERELALHQTMLNTLSESPSPVLQNMKGRVMMIIDNAKSLRKELRQAQETRSTP